MRIPRIARHSVRVGDVGSRAEGTPGPRYDENPVRRGVGHLVEQLPQLEPHLAVGSVLSFRAIERDVHDPRIALDENRFRHGPKPYLFGPFSTSLERSFCHLDYELSTICGHRSNIEPDVDSAVAVRGSPRLALAEDLTRCAGARQPFGCDATYPTGLQRSDRFQRRPEAIRCTRLHFTDDYEISESHDKVDLAGTRTPIPRDDSESACLVPLGCRLLATKTKRRAPRRRRVPRSRRFRLSKALGPIWAQGSPAQGSRSGNRSTFTSRNVRTLTFGTKRAGLYMSQTQASDSSSSRQVGEEPSLTLTFTSFAR